MTDPSMADATYIEPVKWEIVERIIEGATRCYFANYGWSDCAQLCFRFKSAWVLLKYEVELIGASCEAIDKAEDRELFDKAMKIG